MKRLLALALVTAFASVAGAYLVSNSRVGGRFVYESVPANRRPIDILVDTEAVPNVSNPIGITQDLMNQWNAVNEAENVFGTASAGGPYNGITVGDTFGTFTNTQFEAAWDDTGEILTSFGIGQNVLGITLKSVDGGGGQILDFLIIINTRPGFLVAPGSGASSEELFRATFLHELGHALGLGHSPVGMVNPTTFGLALASPQQVPTMFPFRLPQMPQEGGSISGDDVAGVTAIYPRDTSGLGSLSGTVRGASGAPINEIAVRAVGPAGAGEQHVGILSDGDGAGQGRFTIDNLPPGRYRVVVEPVNGRASVTAFSLAGSTDALGSEPFVFAEDEFWQLGDTWKRDQDAPTDFNFVQVRAGRDTGGLDFVLNAGTITNNVTINDSFASGDPQVPDSTGGFHFADYYLFRGTQGDDVTVFSTTSIVTPQLQLLAPGDMSVVASDLPDNGTQAAFDFTLPATGIYTIVVSARATTGNPGGTGSYQLTLSGSGTSALPDPPAVTGAALLQGAGQPALQAFSSPVCSATMIQLRLDAPSHEELWVDGVTLRASGSGDDRNDITSVRLVDDRNGNGRFDGGEPVLGEGTYAANDGSLTFPSLGLELDAGTTMHLIVVYDLTIESVSSAAGGPSWWLLLAALPLLLLRRRALVLALFLAVLPLSCGGGGGGCNGEFNPDGAVVTFETTIEAGDITATTPTSDPGTDLNLPSGDIASGTLSVSN